MAIRAVPVWPRGTAFTGITRIERKWPEVVFWCAAGGSALGEMVASGNQMGEDEWTSGSFADFIEGVLPVPRRRGLTQSVQREGMLREKLIRP